jgi:16S rRNA (cytosine967-C5)-methyltransferase
MSAMNPRTACARILAAVIRGEASLATLLPKYLEKVPPRDRGFLQELCYGTLRHYPALESLLGALLDKPLKLKDAEVTALLATALYQLREMGTAEHAAVNEAVAACRALKRPWARGLVNGVLRRYLRERESLASTLADDPRFRTAHPDWLRQALETAWPDHSRAIFSGNNDRPPMTLRVNPLRGSREDYLADLARAGIEARPALLSRVGVYLGEAVAVDRLPGFADGRVSVQDEAAQLAAPLLAPGPGQRVLDACCAPGGKTGHLLEFEPAVGELIALDIDDERLQRVADNLRRLGLKARLQAADAARPADWWDGNGFHRILLDAPCSGTGVIRRHPDIKLLRRRDDIAKLATTQRQLLETLWRTLIPGGRLLYATCSVLPAENDELVSSFAAATGDCRVLPISGEWGIPTRCGRQLLPDANGPDGFYYALLEKTGPSPEASE